MSNFVEFVTFKLGNGKSVTQRQPVGADSLLEQVKEIGWEPMFDTLKAAGLTMSGVPDFSISEVIFEVSNIVRAGGITTIKERKETGRFVVDKILEDGEVVAVGLRFVEEGDEDATPTVQNIEDYE
jgi:hypothetical protein